MYYYHPSDVVDIKNEIRVLPDYLSILPEKIYFALEISFDIALFKEIFIT